jgi:uncharacterized protein YggE
VHDAKTLQRVFFELQKLGISDVSIEKLDNSKIEQYRKEVKISAVKAAKEKAELIAAALNQQIGKALFVQESDNMNLYTTSNYLSGMASGVNVKIRGASSINNNLDIYEARDEYLDIEFEKIKVESTFLVRFVLE